MTALLILAALLLPWLGALSVLVAGDNRPREQHMLAVAFSVAGAVAALALLPLAQTGAALTVALGSVFGDFTFVPDGMAVFLTAVAEVIGSLAVIFSMDYMKGEKSLGRYYALVLVFIGAMAGLVLAGSLLMLFIFWEITALCSYALISFHNDDPKAVAGGVRALVMTQIGGAGLLAGILLVQSTLGTYDIATFLTGAETLPAATLALVGFGFLLGAAAKSAQVPFQTWLPGAMEAPTPVSALIHAATMVNAGVYLLARFYPAFESIPGWKETVIAIGAISALLAAVMALVAHDLKRVLAYSTVSQLGYMVYAVGAGGIFASQMHLFSHAVFKALLFLGAGAVIHATGTRDMREMGGLGKQMPIVRNVFIIGALALAGLPILNGFWSKELILEAGLAHSPTWSLVIMVAVAGITALYTTRMVWLVFFGGERIKRHVHDAGPAMRVSLIVLAAGTFLTWLLAGPFASLLHNTLPTHDIHALTTGDMITEVVGAPITLVALAVIAVGILLWFGRGAFKSLATLLDVPAQWAAQDFGFSWLTRNAVKLTQDAAGLLRLTQTGVLSWNVAGITLGLIGLMIVLFILAGGAL